MKFSSARVYATVLFEKALENKEGEPVYDLLQTLSNFLEKNPLLIKFFISPLIDREKKLDFLESSPLFKNFCGVLLDNNHIHLLPQILNFYSSFMDKHLQLKEVLIFSSEKLPPKQQQVFKKHFSKNSKLAFYEDSSLLDGYRIYWDGKMLPLSTKDFLQNLKESIETLTP